MIFYAMLAMLGTPSSEITSTRVSYTFTCNEVNLLTEEIQDEFEMTYHAALYPLALVREGNLRAQDSIRQSKAVAVTNNYCNGNR